MWEEGGPLFLTTECTQHNKRIMAVGGGRSQFMSRLLVFPDRLEIS